MSLCSLCEKLSSWLQEAQYRTPDPDYDIRTVTELFHHGMRRELLASREAGCPLCSLLCGLYAAASPTYFAAPIAADEEGYMFIIQLFPLRVSHGNHRQAEYIQLQVYSTTAPAIWPLLSHTEQQPIAEALISIMRGWIEKCVHGHGECLPRGTYQPTRLIDIGPGEGTSDVVLVGTKDFVTANGSTQAASPIRYAALSHCWGSTAHCTTTVASLRQRTTNIPLSDLKKTFKDAIAVARALGLRYLWIDSLCIIQDSAEDWRREAAKMCDVYGNAYITILATSAHDGDDGFLHENLSIDISGSIPTTTKLKRHSTSGHLWIKAVYYEKQNFANSKLSSRAWSMQEVWLSPRVLSFERLATLFACKVHTQDNGQRSGDIGHSLVRGFFEALSPLCEEEELQNRVLRTWRYMVELYSRKVLTLSRDKLPAFAGLASLVGNALGDKYLAGIWESHLPQALAWCADNPTPLGPALRAVPFRAPTWSWASQMIAVRHFPVEGIKSKWDAKVLESVVDVLSDPYGQVQGGFLKMDVKIMEGLLVSSEAGLYTQMGRKFWVSTPESSVSQTSYCDWVVPDDYWSALKLSQVWLCLLGIDDDDVRPRSSMLLLERLQSVDIDNTTGYTYQRVGFVYTAGAEMWDDVARQYIVII